MAVPGLSTRVRLAVAAGLSALPLGLVWSTSPGFLTPGFLIYGDCDYSVEEVCTQNTYVPGAYIPGGHFVGAQASSRVFLVFAALVLLLAATRVRTPLTKRLVRAATGALGIALALAVSQRAVSTLACLSLALGLVAPLVWRTPRSWPARRRPTHLTQ